MSRIERDHRDEFYVTIFLMIRPEKGEKTKTKADYAQGHQKIEV